MAEKRITYKIQDLGGIGEVQIADEVVAIIAGLAATEVNGVASMAGNITNEHTARCPPAASARRAGRPARRGTGRPRPGTSVRDARTRSSSAPPGSRTVGRVSRVAAV